MRVTTSVHPHARGDNYAASLSICAGSGSPPRAWGQRRQSPHRVGQFRFTPTRVGTTKFGRATSRPSSVHPHARGDNFRRLRAELITIGSPPRAWGQRRIHAPKSSAFRFTPTRVGTTATGSRISRTLSVHPHARGDNNYGINQVYSEYGSPPRAWGQLLMLYLPTRKPRFTPTRVGTTPASISPRAFATVHPHARGDNTSSYACTMAVFGSPPRAWGQLGRLGILGLVIRFTPTRVGTTLRWRASSCVTAVHPHARGDNYSTDHIRVAEYGSPPRAWGQRAAGRCRRGKRRFTPTRVGTTCSSWCCPRWLTVHPHARGDNLSGGDYTEESDGSPPRAWGQPRKRGRRSQRRRFTPTRVGTTFFGGYPPAAITVHPHARGDNIVFSQVLHLESGSPPRAWGQRAPRGRRGGLLRFTPTRVGTTQRGHGVFASHAVHPHARGDNSLDMARGEDKRGSPPRAWGQLGPPPLQEPGPRFTPTRVGTTISGSPAARWGTVHPHARGDNLVVARDQQPGTGSPPRAWGQLGWSPRCGSAFRFTPTRVGTTPALPSRPLPLAVHPHARGDNARPHGRQFLELGSPPRAWGQRCILFDFGHLN